MNSPVPFLDVRAAYEELHVEIDSALLRVASSGWYILGAELEEFERKFAKFLGVRHCVGVGNGLDAIRMALLALNIGPGTEVIVPAYTYIATWLAVTETGATPVPVDADESTYNINPELIERVITQRTRVILPVHLYGQPADMDAIRDVARRHDLRVLVDAAQAHGSRYKGSATAVSGDAAAWSFYPSKNLGALGDAGAVTTDSDDLAARVRLLRNYGSRTKYEHEMLASNSRLDEIQAAILSTKLEYLEAWNQRRVAQAARYDDALKHTGLVLPHTPAWAEPAWHLYVVRTRNREALQRALATRKIQTLIHYPMPPHLQAAYRSLNYQPGCFPVSEMLSTQVLSLPIGPHLTSEQQTHVIDTIRQESWR